MARLACWLAAFGTNRKRFAQRAPTPVLTAPWLPPTTSVYVQSPLAKAQNRYPDRLLPSAPLPWGGKRPTGVQKLFEIPLEGLAQLTPRIPIMKKRYSRWKLRCPSLLSPALCSKRPVDNRPQDAILHPLNLQ